MFCKFVVGIRHLSIKIIYTSRTGQMIVLYNNIISNNPDQKPDYKLYFLSIYPPYLQQYPIAYNLHFWTMCKYLFPVSFYPSATGVFYISKTSVRSQNLGMRSTPTSHQKSTLPKLTTSPLPFHSLHHPKIVSNSHTIPKSTSTITSTHQQNIPQPQYKINCQTI